MPRAPRLNNRRDEHNTEAMRECTPKERAFARYAAEGRPYIEAYRLSYDIKPDSLPESQYSEASRIAARPQVRVRIEELIAQREAALLRSSLGDRDRVMQKFRDLMDNAGPEDSVKLRAAVELGRAVGLFERTGQGEDDTDADDLLGEIVRELDGLSAAMEDGPDDRRLTVDSPPAIAPAEDAEA